MNVKELVLSPNYCCMKFIVFHLKWANFRARDSPDVSVVLTVSSASFLENLSYYDLLLLPSSNSG